MLENNVDLRLKLQQGEIADAACPDICLVDKKTMTRLVARMVALRRCRVVQEEVRVVTKMPRTIELLVHVDEPDDGPALTAIRADLPARVVALRATKVPATAPEALSVARIGPARPRMRQDKHVRCASDHYGFVPGRYVRARLLHCCLVRGGQ